MSKPIHIQIKKIIKYGIKFNQIHYGLYVKILDNQNDINVDKNKQVWTNLWISPKHNQALANELDTLSQQASIKVDGDLIITANNQFFNGRNLQLSKGN